MDDEAGIVARLRLPMPVRHLELLADGLQGVYGEGLTMEGAGEWLLIRRPDGDTGA